VTRPPPDDTPAGQASAFGPSRNAASRPPAQFTRQNAGAAALALEGISHSFGSTRALDEAQLVVRPGTLHAVLGENGAGKSTLMRVAFGMLQPDAGSMTLKGRSYAPRSPAEALRSGVGMVHQHFTLVPAMSVAENVALGGRGTFDRRRAAAHVRSLCERTGLTVDPNARVRDLPVPAQQRVEILKALSRGASLLILDEPTAVLAPDDVTELQDWLRSYVERGNTVVLVTHKLREALAVADDITVLRRGRTVLSEPASSLTADDLIAPIVGSGADANARSGAAAPLVRPATERSGRDQADNRKPVVMRATGLRLVREDGSVAIERADISARAGEILGVAGVEGAGQRELLRALAGRIRPADGELQIPDRVGFVPEDRHRDALILGFGLDENVALSGAGSASGRTPWRSIRERAEELISMHDVRAAGVRQPVSALSGGNQQKLVLARELDAGAEALVLENPTRGLDVRAAAAVHERLRTARDTGVAIVLHATDLDEVLPIADRMIVVHAGRVREVPVDREAVGRAMVAMD
jgi:ABC-type uncharacterized transport system ATPase subunit